VLTGERFGGDAQKYRGFTEEALTQVISVIRELDVLSVMPEHNILDISDCVVGYEQIPAITVSPGAGCSLSV
jgi:hypothetical protein